MAPGPTTGEALPLQAAGGLGGPGGGELLFPWVSPAPGPRCGLAEGRRGEEWPATAPHAWAGASCPQPLAGPEGGKSLLSSEVSLPVPATRAALPLQARVLPLPSGHQRPLPVTSLSQTRTRNTPEGTSCAHTSTRPGPDAPVSTRTSETLCTRAHAHAHPSGHAHRSPGLHGHTCAHDPGPARRGSLGAPPWLGSLLQQQEVPEEVAETQPALRGGWGPQGALSRLSPAPPQEPGSPASAELPYCHLPRCPPAPEDPLSTSSSDCQSAVGQGPKRWVEPKDPGKGSLG